MSGRAETLRRWAPVWAAHVVGAFVLVTLVTTGISQVTAGRGDGFLLVLAVTLAVGWVLAARLPRNPLGWLLMAVPVLFAATVPVTLLGAALADTAPDVTAWLYWYGFEREDSWVWLPPIGLLFTQIPLRFPDGMLVSRGWRWFSWFTIFAIVAGSVVFSSAPAEVAPGVPNPGYLPWVAEQSWLGVVVFAGLLAPSFLGSLVSLVVRYRRASVLQRAQIRWVLWATSVVVVALILSWNLPEESVVINQVVGFSYTLIPIAIGVSVLRYRLYEIDRLISRTAAYALVSLVALGVYVLVVTSVHWLLPDLPAIGVALATLAAAALFLPLLRWVRRLVDRRFDRERYNAEKVVDAFGEHLRTAVNPSSTAGELVQAVEQTLQPASVGLWTPGGSR
jgi:hypothetical protein